MPALLAAVAAQEALSMASMAAQTAINEQKAKETVHASLESSKLSSVENISKFAKNGNQAAKDAI